MAEQQIFVSYSRQDAELVRPLVQLLRVAPAFVFLDSDSIKPGDKWRTAVEQAITSANLVVVFWCQHSQQSPEVGKEYSAALDAAKDIVPVLLDSTPVPTALREYQWIDFRNVVAKSHGPLRASPRRISWFRVLVWPIAALALFAAAQWARLTPDGRPLRPFLLALAAAVALLLVLRRLFRQTERGGRPSPRATVVRMPYDAMARDLMAEIKRRSVVRET